MKPNFAPFRRDLNKLVRNKHDELSLAKSLYLIGITLILTFTTKFLFMVIDIINKILHLPSDQFLQGVQHISGLLTPVTLLLAGIATLIGGVYQLSKWLDNKNGYPPAPPPGSPPPPPPPAPGAVD
jgi:hypothetical protein